MHMEFSDLSFRRAAFFVALLISFLSLAEFSSAAKIDPPGFVPKGGMFTSNVVVTLSHSAKEIRYTLDGSEPGTNSMLYAAPLTLTNPAVVKARAFSTNSA